MMYQRMLWFCVNDKLFVNERALMKEKVWANEEFASNASTLHPSFDGRYR